MATIFKKAITEKQIEDRLKKEIGKAFKIFLYLKFKAISFNGVPDRILFLPGGKLYLIELKKPKGGVLSPIQITVHKMLKMLGFKVYVIFTFEDLNEFIDTITL